MWCFDGEIGLILESGFCSHKRNPGAQDATVREYFPVRKQYFSYCK